MASTSHGEEVLRSLHVAEGAASVEAIGGGAAVVLAILGLAGVLPAFMAPIATIAIGVALWFEGGALAARYSKLLDETGRGRFSSTDLGGGVGAEFLGGGAGAVLGILALIGVVPMVLTAVALLTFGAALLLGSAATLRMNTLASSAGAGEAAEHRLATDAVRTAVGAQVLTGIGGIVLGILALVGLAPLTLSLAGLLGVGASLLLSGGAVGGRMIAALHG